jgi:hypothetical protein
MCAAREPMRVYPIGWQIGNVKSDGPELIVPPSQRWAGEPEEGRVICRGRSPDAARS